MNETDSVGKHEVRILIREASKPTGLRRHDLSTLTNHPTNQQPEPEYRLSIPKKQVVRVPSRLWQRTQRQDSSAIW